MPTSVYIPNTDRCFLLSLYLVFTALHAMQTRSSDENSVCLSVCPSVRLSVRLSVCLSVCQIRAL